MATARLINKYNVLLTDATTHDSTILHTSTQLNDSLEYMTKYIDDNYNLDDWHKCYHNNQKSCSIYRYSYVFPKKLIYKLQILDFYDC